MSLKSDTAANFTLLCTLWGRTKQDSFILFLGSFWKAKFRLCSRMKNLVENGSQPPQRSGQSLLLPAKDFPFPYDKPGLSSFDWVKTPS